MKKFTCEKCLKTFNKGWNDEDAEKELSQAPWNIPGDTRGVICDDCFQEFKKWFDSLTPEDHAKIQLDAIKEILWPHGNVLDAM